MNTKLTNKIEELKELFNDNTTQVIIEITAYNNKITVSEVSLRQLEENYVSMKNIKGEFIK